MIGREVKGEAVDQQTRGPAPAKESGEMKAGRGQRVCGLGWTGTPDMRKIELNWEGGG